MVDNDIAGQISQVLSNPQAMSQIQNIAASLGLGSGNKTAEYNSDVHINQNNQQQNNNNQVQNNNNEADNQDSFNPEMLMNMLGSLLGGGNNNNSQPQEAANPLPFDVNTLLTMQKAMSAFNTSNKNVELLKALKPHLSDARKKKIDDAVKIMQLINVLPLIKESGLFDLGGE